MNEKIRRELEILAQPIDFVALEKSGIISKAGAWYRLHVPIFKLPDHLDAKIREVSYDSKGTKVKFYNTSRAEKLLKKHQRRPCS